MNNEDWEGSGDDVIRVLSVIFLECLKTTRE